MNMKLYFVSVIFIQLILLKYTESASWFDSIFGNDSPEEKEDDQIPNTSPALSNSNANNNVVNNANAKETEGLYGGKPSSDMFITSPPLGNIGAPLILNTLGLFTSLLSQGVGGLKRVVDDGTDLTKSAISGINRVNNASLDTVQNLIDSGATKAMDQISSLSKTTDMYRETLSGTGGQNVDKSHSITITTKSDAPLQKFADFAKKYMPAGTSDSGSIPVTSIDLTKLY